MVRERKKRVKNQVDFKKTTKKVGIIKKGSVNETNTSFKSNSLKISAQNISTRDRTANYAIKNSQVISNGNDKQIYLKTLLARTKHFNSKVRIDAWSLLKKAISSFEYLFVENELCQALVDPEKRIRELVKPIVQEAILYPTFDISVLIRFIKLGLTHINSSVQEDCLYMIKFIISERYSLFVPYFNELLDLMIVSFFNHNPIKNGCKVKDSLYECIIQFLSLVNVPQEKNNCPIVRWNAQYNTSNFLLRGNLDNHLHPEISSHLIQKISAFLVKHFSDRSEHIEILVRIQP